MEVKVRVRVGFKVDCMSGMGAASTSGTEEWKGVELGLERGVKTSFYQ